VRTEPPDFDRAGLARLPEQQWSFRAASLEYLPVGFGSHHWEASDALGDRRFVTVDRLTQARLGPDANAAFAALERAFRTATLLRDAAGLEFVVGPLAGRGEAVTHRVGDYAVTVFPFLDSRSTGGERDQVVEMLDRLHAATGKVPQDLPRREDFSIPNRGSLLEALRDLDRPWRTGPFGEQARELLRRSAENLAARLEAYDDLVRIVGETSESWVITHGEPQSANVIRDESGGLFLVDWDTVELAPRERDLWMVVDPDLDSDLDERALRLYRNRWALADVAEFVHLFREPHEQTADTVIAWDALAGYL
jgi:spectinomycin phosphotransferase